MITKIETSHKTLNKTFKKELFEMFKDLKTITETSIMYSKIFVLKNSENKIIALVEKNSDVFKGLNINIK